MANFLMNAWYAAAWSGELGAGQILSRRLLDTRLCLFRTEAGTASAVVDRCPHRFAPFSKGTVKGEAIQCGYHGLAFDRNGQCVENPFNESLPASACAQTFAVEERYNMIWFWPGDATKADPTLIPDLGDLANDGEPQGYLYLKANYQLAIDNLMDLSHIEFVHQRTFGGAGAFFSGQHQTKKTGPAEIWSLWWMPNVDCPMPARPVFGERKVNHWQDMRWNAPSNLYFELGVCPVEVAREDAPKRPAQAHLLTPETSTSTHYFYSKVAGTGGTPGDEMLRIAFEEEDGPMMEACQDNMGDDFWNEKPLILKTDSSAVLVRRTLDQLIRAENEGD